VQRREDRRGGLVKGTIRKGGRSRRVICLMEMQYDKETASGGR
jgi:hypothetical protein